VHSLSHCRGSYDQRKEAPSPLSSPLTISQTWSIVSVMSFSVFCGVFLAECQIVFEDAARRSARWPCHSSRIGCSSNELRCRGYEQIWDEVVFGAGERSRTVTTLRSADFGSAASAIAPLRRSHKAKYGGPRGARTLPFFRRSGPSFTVASCCQWARKSGIAWHWLSYLNGRQIVKKPYKSRISRFSQGFEKEESRRRESNPHGE
jgi:hypothetical protein